MTGFYACLLDIGRCRVLVVGGGTVAHRKVEGVLAAGGRPVVVAPQLADGLEMLIREEKLAVHRRVFEPHDVEGYQLVFAATDHAPVNQAVRREAELNGALVNVADDPEGSTFHVPAVLRHDPVLVALSTGGASPLLARRLRERLADTVTPGLGRVARRLEQLRETVRGRWPADGDLRRDFWTRLVTPEFVDLAIAGRDEEVESRISICLSRS